MQSQRQPTLFASLLNSCVRYSFYAEIAKTSLARAFAFLTLLAAVAAISFTVYVHRVILPSLARASDKLPTLSIKNGKVEVEGMEGTNTTIYADPAKVLRIDLDLETSKAQRVLRSDYDYTVVITKYTIIFKRLGGEDHSFSLPYGFSVTIARESLGIFLHSWLWMILAAVLVGSFACFWVLRLAYALVLTIPGLVFWGILRRDLTYPKLFILCTYALGPPTLLGVLFLWLNARFVLPQQLFEFQWIIFFVVALQYLLGGMIAVKHPFVPKAFEKSPIERYY